MALQPSPRRFDSIPLPETVTDALNPVPRDDDSVSFKVDGRRLTSPDEIREALRSMGHAFYVGRFVPLSTGERVRRLLGFKGVPERLYSEEFLESVLGYLAHHLPEGAEARLVYGGALREFFPDGEACGEALSYEDFRDLICDMVELKFGSEENIHVSNLEDDPLHQRLIARLREAMNPATGETNVAAALDGEGRLYTLRMMDSHTWACFLYRATQQDPRVFGAFSATRTRKQKELYGDDPGHASHYYALAEVAMRLADFFGNRISLQGGTDQQGKYDDIIAGLLRGERGRFRGSEALAPLFEWLRKNPPPPFGTLHVTTSDSYPARKARQTRARIRSMIFAAAGLAAGTAVWQAGYERGQEDALHETEALDDYLARELENVDFYVDHKFEIAQDDKLSYFKGELVPSLMKDLGIRYQLGAERFVSLQLKQLLIQHLIRNKGLLRNSPDDQETRILLLDSFVRENEAYFLAQDLDFGRPYLAFAAYRGAFDNTEALDREIEVRADVGPSIDDQYIGEFIATESYAFAVELYVVHVGGIPYLMGRDRAHETVNPDGTWGPKMFSTRVGKRYVAAFRRASKKYDVAPLAAHRREFPFYVLEEGEDRTVLTEEAPFLKRLPDYADYYDGRFHYELGVYSFWDDEKKVERKVLVARDVQRGDTNFSTQTAREVHDWLCEVEGCHPTFL